jgi:hypothetical protein
MKSHATTPVCRKFCFAIDSMLAKKLFSGGQLDIPMSWSFLIYRPGKTRQNSEPLGKIGDITAALNNEFKGLQWRTPREASLPVGAGFLLELTEEDGIVEDMYTHVAYHHIQRFAALCKREGWKMADAEEGEDVDLDNPQRWIEDRTG